MRRSERILWLVGGAAAPRADDAPAAGDGRAQTALRTVAGGSGGGAVLARCPAVAGLTPIVACLCCSHFGGLVERLDGAAALRCGWPPARALATPSIVAAG
jgi:hypothetical protein